MMAVTTRVRYNLRLNRYQIFILRKFYLSNWQKWLYNETHKVNKQSIELTQYISKILRILSTVW